MGQSGAQRMTVEELDDDAEFLGTHRHALDTKGRLVLPASFRDQLKDGMFMTIGFDNCLTVQTDRQWQRTRARLRQLNTSNPRARKFARLVTSNAERTTLDKQGRITIPPAHRRYARLDKDVTVVGAETRVEIWDTTRWDTYHGGGLDELAELADEFDMNIF